MAYDPDIQKQIAKSAEAVNKALGEARMGTKRGLESFGQDFTARMYDILNQPGTGIQWPSLPNQSSAPGEAPAPQSETYRDSWDYKVGEDEDGYFVDCGSPVEYGGDLEYGTSEIDPRPHLRPLVDQMKGVLGKHLVGEAEGGENEAFAKTHELVDELLGGGE